MTPRADTSHLRSTDLEAFRVSSFLPHGSGSAGPRLGGLPLPPSCKSYGFPTLVSSFRVSSHNWLIDGGTGMSLTCHRMLPIRALNKIVPSWALGGKFLMLWSIGCAVYRKPKSYGKSGKGGVVSLRSPVACRGGRLSRSPY